VAPLAFGAQLRSLRMAAGLTQEELAEPAGLSARGIADLERGTRKSPYAETVDLCSALRLGPDERDRLAAARRRALSSPSLSCRFQPVSAASSVEKSRSRTSRSIFSVSGC
jgi:transcriptional regulator with XRE-family HTH domain